VRRDGKLIAVLAALMVVTVAVPSYSVPGYSPIHYPPTGGMSHEEILEDVYEVEFSVSGTFEGFEGIGGINAYRVYDQDELLSLHVVTGDQTHIDQIWTDGIAMVSAEAKYSAQGHPQSFGWNEGGTGTNYVELLNEVGDSALIPINGDFLWGFRPGDDEWWSLQSLNGGYDHMVTYYITGADLYGETIWLLFLENAPTSPDDWDYNDFVVEITAVPEPATICLFGLGALALLRKRRK